MIEIPAGMRDIEGEDTAEVARRELIEEAGLAAAHVDLLTEILPSPGLTDSVTSIYLATGCTPARPTARVRRRSTWRCSTCRSTTRWRWSTAARSATRRPSSGC